MNCDLVKTQFVDLLYDELDQASTQAVHTHLRSCGACKKELDALQGTRHLLKAIPQEEPGERIIFTATPKRTFAEWWQDMRAVLPQAAWARLSLGVAAVAFFLLIAGSISNFQVQKTDQGFAVDLGLLPKQQAELSPEVIEAVLARARQENAQYTAKLLAASEAKQKQEWNDTFTDFALKMDRKHDTELYLIGNQLERMNETTNQQFRQLMRSVNLQR